MAVAFVRNHTGASIKTAGTNNLGVNISSTGVAGNTYVARILFDNFTTASKPVVSSIGTAAGETNSWVFLGAARSTSTTAGAFASGEIWAIRTTVPWPISAFYTVTLDSSVTMKATHVQEFSGVTSTARSTAGTAYSATTTAASATTTGTTPVIDDLAVGFIFGSNVGAAQAGDTDTTGGSWSAVAGVGSTGGSGTTNNFGVGQYKILTGANHQTLNNSAAMTAGNGAIVAILQAYVPPSITQAAYRLYADGTESGSTALAAQDASYTADVTNGDVVGQVRIRLQNTSAVSGDPWDEYHLQWEKNTSGTWIPAGAVLSEAYSATPSMQSILPTTHNFTGQTFLGDGKRLGKWAAYLQRVGTPAGMLQAKVYAHTGTFGSGGMGTGPPLAVAEIAHTDVSTTSGWVQFTFPDPALLESGTPYCVVMGGTVVGDGTNDIRAGRATTPSHAGNATFYDVGTSAWSATTADYMFVTYTYIGVHGYSSASVTEGEATTNRLTGGTGSFVAGKVSEDSVLDDLALTANNYTELLYTVTLKKADFANGDTARFRVNRNLDTAGFTYTQYPTISITKTPVAITQAAYRFYADGTETGSTALTAQNAAPTVDLSSGDVNLQLRTMLQSTTAASIDSTDDFQLQWEKNASGSWSIAAGPSVESLADSYESAPDVYFSMTAANSGSGQSFLGNGQHLTKASFYLRKAASPTGTLTAYLHAHNGIFGSAATPVSFPIATSTTTIVASTLTTSGAWYNFTFAQIPSTLLTAGTPYFVVVRIDAADVTNKVEAGWLTTGSHAGNGATSVGGAWTDGDDRLFRVYTTPSPAPILIYNSPNLTDAAATTSRLTITLSSVLADSNPAANYSFGWAMNRDSDTSMAQSFLGNDQLLTRAVFDLRKSSTPTGTIIAHLYAHSGVFGSGSSVPTGAPLVSSSTVVDASTLPTTHAMLSFDFSPTLLVKNTAYFVSVQFTTSSATGNVWVGYDDTPGHVGATATERAGVWSGLTSYEAIFEVYTKPNFTPGQVSETGLVSNLGWSGNNYTELLYSLTLKQADLADGDTLRFRVLRNGATTDLTYTQTPTISVTKVGGPPPSLPPRNIRMTNAATLRSFTR